MDDDDDELCICFLCCDDCFLYLDDSYDAENRRKSTSDEKETKKIPAIAMIPTETINLVVMSRT